MPGAGPRSPAPQPLTPGTSGDSKAITTVEPDLVARSVEKGGVMRSTLRRVLLLVSATSLLLGYFSAMPAANAAAPKCFGKSATIVSSKSLIKGTKGADVIVATGKGKH